MDNSYFQKTIWVLWFKGIGHLNDCTSRSHSKQKSSQNVMVQRRLHVYHKLRKQDDYMLRGIELKMVLRFAGVLSSNLF